MIEGLRLGRGIFFEQFRKFRGQADLSALNLEG